MSMKVTNEGAYATLTAQLDKLARHNRQGSFRTKERYYEACKRFARTLRTNTACKSCPTSAASIL